MELTRQQRNYLSNELNRFMGDNEYATKHFIKHFGARRAKVKLPGPTLYGIVDRGVVYDNDMKFDIRMLASIIHPDDLMLFKDIAIFVGEYFVNNPEKPASDLTLQQFKAILTRRMHQVGF